MENLNIDTGSIKGWGSDLDPANRPAVPMWQRPPEGTGAHWSRPPQQELKFKEFHSIERPEYSAVIGTSVAPKGLSGLIRAYAFRYSESSWGHWLPLMLADRINVVEGIFSDLLHGHIPNVYAEMGLKSEFKYNKKGLAKKAAVTGLFAVAGIALFAYLNSNKTEKLES